ncbi:MAG: endolytic transglycosylase MltG [Patescibacteria group bacterium]
MMQKFFLFVLAVAFFAAVIGGLFLWNEVNFPMSSTSQPATFTIAKGEGVNDIAVHLKSQGLIRNSLAFKVYAYFKRSQTKFTDGMYSVDKNMTIRDIFTLLVSNQTTPETTITLIEGWTAKDMAEYLAAQGIVSAENFIAAASVHDSRSIIPNMTYAFLADRPAGAALEGYLFPDTYRVFKTTTASQIVEKMLDNFGNKFTDQMKTDTANGNMSIYQIVTLASIIEKEVRTDADRKIAAGIFYDRMNQGVALQSDATVNYVTGKQALQPTADDLSVDSPYNTYKYTGLPPGPICNPSLASIMAAIYPEKTEYFYFLTKPDGTTVFSKTYEEHLQNKQKYLQ